MTTVRTKCIFCRELLTTTYFDIDYECYAAHYQVDSLMSLEEMYKLPFNICVCSKCNTVQTKYLAPLDIIYQTNHADSTGSTMMQLHELNSVLISKYVDKINGIMEIGSSIGVLADKILDKHNTIKYTIVEPCYYGRRDNKIIIDSFYEDVIDSNINANTVVISHVFEHFYEPLVILEKICSNKSIVNFFLVFPDLEYYINNDIHHVLNTEHTYYVDNDFLVELFDTYGFKLVEQNSYKGHSVLFYFVRPSPDAPIKVLNAQNKNYSLDKFYGNIISKVSYCNELMKNTPDTEYYLWPASIHSLYLCIFGLNMSYIKSLIDNSKSKIGKKLYGTNLIIKSFDDIFQDIENKCVILNGGVFTQEIINNLNTKNIKYMIL